MAGRHWILPVGRNFLQETILTATENRQYMAWDFRHMWAWSCFPSCVELRGTWPSILKPSMMHDSPRDRACHLMKKMHATHKWGPRPYHVEVKGLGDRELRHVTSLIVWTPLNPHTWFDTPTQVMQCMICKHGSKWNMISRCKACQMPYKHYGEYAMLGMRDTNATQTWTI